MLHRLPTLGCVLTLALAACAPRAATPPAHAASVTLSGSEAVIELLVHAEYVELEHMFEPALKAEVPASKVASVWSVLTRDRGAFELIESKRTLRDASGTTDVCLLRFARGPVEVVVRWNGSQVSGLHLSSGDRRSRALSLAELAWRGDAAALHPQLTAAGKTRQPLAELTALVAQARSSLGAGVQLESITIATVPGFDAVTVLDEATIRARGDAGGVDLKLAFKRGSTELERVQALPLTPAATPSQLGPAFEGNP